MRNRNRDGFTMVELLVVIAVIAMLVAILLPAINSAREAARNTQCKNRIRQVAVATNQYQGRMNAYPGFRSRLDSVPMSWVLRIAPDLGERNLYEVWRTGSAPGTYQNPPYVSLLVCPSDPLVSEAGPSLSYMANAGRAGESPEVNMPQFGVFLDQMPPKPIDAIPATTEAFITDQGDGLGQTLMLAENIQLLLGNGQTGTRWDVPNPGIKALQDGNKMSNVVVWHCTSNPSPVMKVGGDPRVRMLSAETARPASNHPGGVNVAFCDTRVIFLRDDVDYSIYIRLMAPFDRGAVRLDPTCGEAMGELRPLSSVDYE